MEEPKMKKISTRGQIDTHGPRFFSIVIQSQLPRNKSIGEMCWPVKMTEMPSKMEGLQKQVQWEIEEPLGLYRETSAITAFRLLVAQDHSGLESWCGWKKQSVKHCCVPRIPLWVASVTPTHLPTGQRDWNAEIHTYPALSTSLCGWWYLSVTA